MRAALQARIETPTWITGQRHGSLPQHRNVITNDPVIWRFWLPGAGRSPLSAEPGGAGEPPPETVGDQSSSDVWSFAVEAAL